ncbi:unnamed protein product [Caenorhabditis brenneri]
MQVALAIPSSHLNLKFPVSSRSSGRNKVDSSWNPDKLNGNNDYRIVYVYLFTSGLFTASNIAKCRYDQQLDGECRCSNERGLKTRTRQVASLQDNNGINARR